MGSGEKMKSCQKLRIKTGPATNKTAGQMRQHADKQPANFIRNGSVIMLPNLMATNKACLPDRRPGLKIPAEKLSRKTRQVSLSNLYPVSQSLENQWKTVTPNALKLSEENEQMRSKIAAAARTP
jgi:hypothetical protein